jgi:hypothetical protein
MPELVVGANLPWLEYGHDFGASSWNPRGGVAQPAARERMRRALGRVAETGSTLVRWWLLGDGRAGLRETPSGRVVGLDRYLYDDVDAAIEALEEAGLRALFVLTDFLWFGAPRLVRGVQLGGRRHAVRDARARAELLESVFAPLAERYGRARAIWGWDLVNEPEWATLAVGTVDPRRSLSLGEMRRFLAELAAVLRPRVAQPITVGLASARWLSLVEGLGLDCYQVHWYESLDSLATLARPVAERRLDRPLLLGEFPTRGARTPPGELLAIASRAGYAAALAWSALADDEATDGEACLSSLLAWSAGGAAAGAERA